MTTHTTPKPALVLNTLVCLMEFGAVVSGMAHRGVSALMYYTVLSNLLGCIACAICFAYELREYRQQTEVPHAARTLKYMAASCLLMTFVISAFVLAPMYVANGQNGYYLMFCRRELPITHLFAPLLVCVSYVLFEADRTMTARQSLIAFVPTLVYAAVAYACNIARVWSGPYPFLMVWNMPPWQSILWFVVLCVLALGLCQVPRLLGRRFCRRD